jgi:hypothetical protein
MTGVSDSQNETHSYVLFFTFRTVNCTVLLTRGTEIYSLQISLLASRFTDVISFCRLAKIYSFFVITSILLGG